MDGEQFYELTLDDCATPSFISGAKSFFGRLSDIRSFVTALEQDERLAIVQYLRDLPLNIDIEVNGVQYKLVHAAPIEWYSEQCYDSVEEYAVWERLPERIRDTDYVMIQGHTPTMFFQYGNPLSIWYGKNRIDLDCGSGFDDGFTRHRTFRPAGRLACLRLDDMKAFYSEEYAGRKAQTGGENKPDLN